MKTLHTDPANPTARPDYWYVSEGDEVEFQVRSSREYDGVIQSGRVTQIGTILGAPYFETRAGRWMLSDLLTFRNLTMGR